jgi:L-ribulokinase
MPDNYVIGVDFGTDSVRAVVVDTADGRELGSSVFAYPRWAKGLYCDPVNNQFRQHPLDYIEGLEATVKGALKQCPPDSAAKVKGIAIDTTGSTPCAADYAGKPLALKLGFEENPNAMFVLWKDHTGVHEAEQINALARTWGGEDFTKYEGGVYSSEWFWAKILHVLRADEKVRAASGTWIEHCDWIPALLTGVTDAQKIKRSRCAAGHKAMWHPSWKGLPPEGFLTRLDPVLLGVREKLYHDTHTSENSAGALCPEWAERLGLSPQVKVAVGAFDAHMGAVGGGIRPHILVKIMGTSTCDILTTSSAELGQKLVKGICGQVDGSVVAGMMGLEAGQSAFGDIYAWFKNLLGFGLGLVDASAAATAADALIPALEAEAKKIPIGSSGVLALDWMNGRRTPDANQRLRGVIANLNLGSDAPALYRALVEATAFGARKINDRFAEEGVAVKGVIALGGVAKKSPFVMQVLADVLDMPVKVVRSEQACALGAAMFAAVASGLFADASAAQKAMESGFETEYQPIPENAKKYRELYARYSKLGNLIEGQFTQGHA